MSDGSFGLGKVDHLAGIVQQFGKERPFVICANGTVVYGNVRKAKRQGRKTVAAYVLDADPSDPRTAKTLRALRTRIVAMYGPDR